MTPRNEAMADVEVSESDGYSLSRVVQSAPSLRLRFHSRVNGSDEEPNLVTTVDTPAHSLEGDGGSNEIQRTAYGTRFQRMGEPEDMKTSIEHFSRALRLTPNGHPSMPGLHDNLGVAYCDRFKHLGEPRDLEKSIERRSCALELTPNGHPDMPRRHDGLGVAYNERFRLLGEPEDIEKAIEHRSRALELTPNGHPDVSRRHDGLGAAYNYRFNRLGESGDLEKSIEHFSRALELTPKGHPEMPRRHHGLGVAYRDRFQRLGEPEDIEKSIKHRSRALELTPKGHPDTPHRHDGLGVAYGDRFHHLGEPEDLQKSIEHYSHALEMTPNGHPDVSRRHSGLGVAYGDRFHHLGEPEDLEKSIEHRSCALELIPNGHPDMPHLYNGLGVAYGDRFRCLGETGDIEKAIEHFSRALELTPDGHPDMPRRHTDLGMAHTDRFQCLDEPEDIEKAIKYYIQALKLTSNGHPNLPRQYCNLAIAYLHQSRRTGHLSFSSQALHHFRSASQLLPGAPRHRFQYALAWAQYASTHSSLNSIEAHQTTIDLLPQFIWLGATTTQRYRDLSAVQNLAVNAADAAIRSSNFLLALEWLEHARCVVWTQSLMLRSPVDRLHSSRPDLATGLQATAKELHILSSETYSVQALSSGPFLREQVGQERRRLAQEYESLLAKARQLSGFEDFLQPMKAAGLVRAARNGPIIIINCHESYCDALIIQPGGTNAAHLHLPNFNNVRAKRAWSEMEYSLGRRGLRERGVKLMNEPEYKDRTGSMLERLWNDVVRPVLNFLGYLKSSSAEGLPHITWCPTGALSFLPLHAAGDYNQPRSRVFDYVISSYTPTLTAILNSSPTSVTRKPRILAVGQPNTPGHNPLPGTLIELANLQAHTQGKAEYSQLVRHQATKQAVLDAMDSHDWVHLACHAHQNLIDPTKSGFYLHDGTLDLAAINQRSFKNKGLAFLSACQTATGDEKLPDEAVHLASGMLMAGYPSVIATMWSVVDEDAPLIADKVYAELMKEGKVGNGGAGKALYHAVAVLREKVGEKEFRRWVPYIHIGS